MYTEDSHQGYSHLSFAFKKMHPMTAIPSTPFIGTSLLMGRTFIPTIFPYEIPSGKLT